MRPAGLIATLRGASWALRAIRSARRAVAADGFTSIAVPSARTLPPDGSRGVRAVLARTRSTCLVEATVRQAWDADHGVDRDLIIGVTAPGSGFSAHAWLDGDPPCHRADFHELLRRPARR